METKQLKVKLPKGYAPFGKMEVIAKNKDLYLIIDLVSADFKKLLEIVLKNDERTNKQ